MGHLDIPAMTSCPRHRPPPSLSAPSGPRSGGRPLAHLVQIAHGRRSAAGDGPCRSLCEYLGLHTHRPHVAAHGLVGVTHITCICSRLGVS